MRYALADLHPDSTRFEVGEMCDASECFDEILTQIGEAIKRRKKLKSKGFLKIVGYELVKRYQCDCKKKNEFPLDPNQFMLFT